MVTGCSAAFLSSSKLTDTFFSQMFDVCDVKLTKRKNNNNKHNNFSNLECMTLNCMNINSQNSLFIYYLYHNKSKKKKLK